MIGKILVIGATGMLGQALMDQDAGSGLDIVGMARSGSDINIDICDDMALLDALGKIKPSVVINTAAISSVDFCERNPGQAYAVNARAVSVISDFTRKNGTYLVQISTDHYYSGDGRKLHVENDPVCLMNEYARTKFAGECYALVSGNALVVRTNIVGFRGDVNRPTFLEWVLQQLEKQIHFSMYDDFYTSSVDVNSLAKALFTLLSCRPVGILNIASSNVQSKKEFIEAFAMAIGLRLECAGISSVRDISGARRGDSLGLDVSMAEGVLGYSLPGIEEVISNLVIEYRRRSERAV